MREVVLSLIILVCGFIEILRFYLDERIVEKYYNTGESGFTLLHLLVFEPFIKHNFYEGDRCILGFVIRNGKTWVESDIINNVLCFKLCPSGNY